MTYNEWRDELKSNLLSVSEAERRRVLDYYAEAYADRREAGFSEREIIEDFGAPYDAAKRILSENANGGYYYEPEQKHGANRRSAPVPPPPPPQPVPATAPAAPAGAAEKSGKKHKGLTAFFITLAVIIGVGLAVVLGLLAFNGWTFKPPAFEMRSYTAEYDYSDLDIEIGAGSVKTEFYDGDKITIDYPYSSVYTSDISERNGVFRYKSRLKWHLGSLNIPDIVIKLPNSVNYNLDFELNAGSANIASGTYGKLDIDVDAGKVSVAQVVCTEFNCDVSAGLLEVNGLICNKFDGDVSAGKLNVKALNCPDITADVSAGELIIGVEGAKADYDIRAKVSAGSCNVSNQTGSGGKRLNVECSAGSIKIDFAS